MMNTDSFRNSILVIDDDPDILDVVSLVLSSEGYNVRTAHDRDEGLALLSNHYHPDALLLDWAMPGLAIEPFLNEVRKLGLHEQTILVTAGFRAADKAKELGLRRFLAKPFDYSALLDAVKSSLPR